MTLLLLPRWDEVAAQTCRAATLIVVMQGDAPERFGRSVVLRCERLPCSVLARDGVAVVAGHDDGKMAEAVAGCAMPTLLVVSPRLSEALTAAVVRAQRQPRSVLAWDDTTLTAPLRVHASNAVVETLHLFPDEESP